MTYIDSLKLLNVLFKASKLASKIVKDPKALKILSTIERGNNALLDVNLKDLITYAYINKVLSLLLIKESRHKLLRSLRHKLLHQRSNFLNHLKHIIDVLDTCQVNYVIFKTLRPVPETPVDIDVLVESKDDARYAMMHLKKRFHVEVWSEDRYSIGIRIPEFNEYIDFYVKPHVADLVYMDSEVLIKNKMYLFVNEVSIEVLVPVPKPELEFCSILAHSIIKEGLITLNDVVSLIAYELLSSKDELTQWLSKLSLKIAYREFINKLEGTFPIRINYMTIFKVLISLLRKRYAASSLPHFALSLSKRLDRIIKRYKRLTYVRGLER